MKVSLNANENGKRDQLTLFIFVWLLAAVLVISGCTTNSADETAPAGDDAVQLSEEAEIYLDMSRAALAELLPVSEEQIELDSITEPAVVDGTYIVKLEVDGQTYEFHGSNGEVLLVSEPLPLAPSN